MLVTSVLEATTKGKDVFRSIRNEIGKLKLPVIITTVLLSIAAVFLSCTLYKNYSMNYDIEAWEVGTEIIDFLFPLFVVTPICWGLYYERRNSFLTYTLPRISKARYLTAKWLASAISAFVIVFVPYFLSAVVVLYVKPPIEPWRYPFDRFLLDVYVNMPQMYALLLSLWKSMIGVLVMSLGFILALYVKNLFVILTGPFIYTILENFTLAIMQVPQYRLISSFVPTSVSTNVISFFSLSVGPMLLIAIIMLLWLFFAKVKRESVYQT